jgi:class 3 adenylate cyclase
MPLVRRLAAIFAADVAGYSRAMGADEESALVALKGAAGACLIRKSAIRNVGRPRQELGGEGSTIRFLT